MSEAPPGPRVPGGGPGGPLVGREPELAAMQAALAQAEAGQGRLLLVTGEPGIGKSALVDSFTSQAVARGARVLWGAAWEGGGAPAYWPWVQVLRGVTPDLTAPDLRRSDQLARDLSPLGRLLPELGPPQAGGPGGEGERFALFDAVVAALRLVSANAPLVVVIEDLHAAGMPSALLLQFAARHARGVPVLLVATYREVEARLTPGVGEIVAALEGAGTVLPLPALSVPEVRDLVAPVLAEVPAALLDAIMERTKGNPLFVAQVARLLAQTPGSRDPGSQEPGSQEPGSQEPAGSRVAHAAPIPAGIQQAVRQRLDRLADPGEVCREALTVSAVLGGEADLAEVAVVLDTPAVDLLEALGPAVDAGLLVDLGRYRYRFVHSLVRETIYRDLPPAERARRHHRIGTVLAARHPGGASHARIAYHLLAAAPVGDAEAAVRHATAAGGEAMAALGYEEAASLFQQAVSALHHVDPAGSGTGTGDPTERRCELLLSLGEALLKAADLGRAQPVLVQATEHARQSGNGELLGRSALLRAEHLDFNAVDPDTIALLEEAAQQLAGTDTPMLARVHARLAIALSLGAPERMVAAADRAVEAGRRAGDPAALAQALSSRLHSRWGRHEPRAALAEGEEVARLADQTGDAELAVNGHMWRFIFSLELGELAGARRALARVTELAEGSGQPLLRLLAASRASTLAALAGRFDAALAHADEALEIGLRARLPDAEPVYWSQLFAVWRLVGLPAEREARMERILRDLSGWSVHHAAHEAALALVDLSQGARAEAAARFEALLPRMSEIRDNVMNVWTLAMMAEGGIALGAVGAAETVYRELLPFADRFVVASGVFCGGSVHHYLAGLAGLAGRLDDAAHHYQAAIEQQRRAGATPMLARSCQEYARLLRRRGGAGDAQRADAVCRRGVAGSVEPGSVEPGRGGPGRRGRSGHRDR